MGRKKLPGKDTLRGLLPVVRFTIPHWRGIALSVLLMAVQATANTGRLILFYPILTRVLLPQSMASGEPGSPGATSAADAQKIVESVKKRAGNLAGFLERATDRANSITGHLVPDAWVEAAVPDDASPEDAAAARKLRLDQYATLLTVLFLFVLFILVMGVSSYGESYVAERVRLRILMDVREALCRKLLDQPVGFYDSKHRGDLVQRVLGDVEGYAKALRHLLDGVVRGLLHIVVTLIFLIGLSWQLTLVCMLGLPFFLPMRTLMRRTLKRAHRRQQQSAKRVEVLLQMFSGIRTVKAFGTEERRAREFRATDEEVTRRALKVQRARSSADALTAFINNFLAMLLAVGGGFLILRNVLPVQSGELVMFLVLVGNLYQPLKRVVKQLAGLQDSMASVERTTEYLSLPSGSPDRADAVAFPGVRDAIRFERVSFAYVPDTPVLRDVSFEIPRGATVALVGPSGGGKSTLCDLLLRFYDPSTGQITIDGQDVRAFQRASLLAHTAVVTQAPFLFHTTIQENIRQGKLDATTEEIVAAAKAAQIHDFL
ncbi:MAG: ABC transporter ATP-binding protein, partial [Planctomycetota bacterium]